MQHALYRAAKADSGRRFHALRDKIYRRDVLWSAWVTVYRNGGAPGIDMITRAGVEVNMSRYRSSSVLGVDRHDVPGVTILDEIRLGEEDIGLKLLDVVMSGTE